MKQVHWVGIGLGTIILLVAAVLLVSQRAETVEVEAGDQMCREILDSARVELNRGNLNLAEFHLRRAVDFCERRQADYNAVWSEFERARRSQPRNQ